MQHECKIEFETMKIDDCCGTAFNRCSGIEKMVLEIYSCDKDGQEFFYDNWIEVEGINFCPFCGLKSQPERLNEIALKDGAKV